MIFLRHKGRSDQTHPRSTHKNTHTNHCSPAKGKGLADGAHVLLQPLTGATESVSQSSIKFCTHRSGWSDGDTPSLFFGKRDGGTGTPSSELPGATDL